MLVGVDTTHLTCQGSVPASAAHALTEQALDCVDGAIASVDCDPEGALDDLIAARLLLVTALAVG